MNTFKIKKILIFFIIFLFFILCDNPNCAYDQSVSLEDKIQLLINKRDYLDAIPLVEDALQKRKQILGPDHLEIAILSNTLAFLYKITGDYAKAVKFYSSACKIFEKQLGNNHKSTLKCLNNLAALHEAVGAYDLAESLMLKVLPRMTQLYNKHECCIILNNLASLYSADEKYDKADFFFKLAMSSCPANEVPLLEINRAFLYIKMGGKKKLKKALSIFKKYKSPEGIARCYLIEKKYEEAKNLFKSALAFNKDTGAKKYIIGDYIGLGLAYEGQKKWKRAEEFFRLAIKLIQRQWRQLSFLERKNFLSGEVGAGFYRLDAYNGLIRVLISQNELKQAVNIVEKVKSRILLELLAGKKITVKGEQNNRILAKDWEFQKEIQVLRAKHASKTKLNKILKEYEKFLSSKKLQTYEVGSLITDVTIPISTIQQKLDDTITLLEYYVMPQKTFVWIISRNCIQLKRLSMGEKQLYLLANKLRLLITDINEYKMNRKRYLEISNKLYKELFQPIIGEIKTKSLVIIPHKVLHKISFALLYDKQHFLIEKFNISYVPSLNILYYVIKKRKKGQHGHLRLLALANPITDQAALPSAEREVENIKNFFKYHMVLKKEKASETVVKAKSSEYNVIHFACHGEFNEKLPLQSSLLLTKDDKNDGYLQVHEIFSLYLKNTEFVVLSACETALGKIYGGDDLIGFTRSFIFAGTPSILATLWEIDDDATAELMTCFYNNWLHKNMTKPEALRKAQMALLHSNWEHPFYWGAFLILGDWH